MNKIKEELNKWRNFLCLWIGRFSIFKMLVLPNLIYRFNGIPPRIGFHIFGQNCFESKSKIFGLEVKWSLSINCGHLIIVQFLQI